MCDYRETAWPCCGGGGGGGGGGAGAGVGWGEVETCGEWEGVVERGDLEIEGGGRGAVVRHCWWREEEEMGWRRRVVACVRWRAWRAWRAWSAGHGVSLVLGRREAGFLAAV